MANNKNSKKSSLPGFLKLVSPTNILPKTFGQKAADLISKWAGSWTFIISFLLFLTLWMIVNTTWIVFGKTWDNYPFILLNLALSCVAALQAPIILMSQNRQTERDRVQAKYDYSVNRKAEREIKDIQKQLNRIEKHLHKKK
ncbi:DUF1003 domain-containing protein [Candidatus Pacearchaeota archaeon]|nr:DUF1003 domain-containing protein [Candidatus Pacearchaeota archaeon]